MKVSELLLELDLKGAAKKSGLAKLHADQQAKKKNEFEAKYNTGMPTKVKVKVYVKKPAYKQEDPYEIREFTIDNLIAIRHKLDGITLIDMSSVEDDKTKHDGKATWAIKKDGKTVAGGLPEYLHGLPARTRKKPGFDSYDLRREAWTDSPMPTYEAVGMTEKEVRAKMGANASFYFEQLGIHDGGDENKTVSCTAEDESGKKWKLTRMGKYSNYRYTLAAIVKESYETVYGFEIDPNCWYVVDDPSKMIYGHFDSKAAAEKAVGTWRTSDQDGEDEHIEGKVILGSTLLKRK